MKIKDIRMDMSAVKKEQYPDDGLPQIAFVGRSNVGKSSSINTLLKRKKIARVSQTPGKTRTINFYKINSEFYFVDLPGYGYAKLSKEEKSSWGKVMEEYFINSKNLIHVFILVDIRHEPKEDDVLMLDFVRHYGIPVSIIATKSDKVTRNDAAISKRTIKSKMKLEGERILPISALKKTGVEEIWNHVLEIYRENGYEISEEHNNKITTKLQRGYIMNRRKISLEYFILSLFLGVLIVVQTNSPLQYSPYSSSVSRELVSQINKEKSEMNSLEEKLGSLNKQYRKLQTEYENQNMGLSKEDKDKYYNYRMMLGLEKLSGEGVEIKLESVEAKNIAFDTETNRLLLKLVKKKKKSGGEVISINNQIITGTSEITLAGNHINVNNVPVSPPYEIKVIGNEKTLYRNLKEKDVMLRSWESSYGIKSDVSKTRKITIPPLSVQKDIEYLRKGE